MNRGAWWVTSQWGRKESETTERLHFTSLLHRHVQLTGETF